MVTKARQLAEFIANADVDSDEIATGAVSASKLADTLDLSSKTIVMPDVAAFNITSGDRVGIKNSGTDISGTSLDDLVVGAGTTLAGMVLDGGASNDTAYGFASAGTKVGRIQYINSSNNMVFQTNNANRMVIDGSGDVGIGVTTPSESLDIGGGSIRIGNSKIRHSGSGGSWDMAFETYSGGYFERMRIDSVGNVGIGTTAPALNADYDRVLHIHSTLGSLIKLTDATSGSAVTDGTDLLNYGNDSYLINRDAGHLIFYTSSADRMRITSGGDVSIGSGHGGFSGWRVLNIRQLSTGGMVNFEDDDGTRAFTFASQGSGMRYQAHISGGYHRWETNATANALYITDGGNVGIGTNSPAANLDISNSSSIPYITLGRTPFSTYGNLTIGGAATSGWITSNTDGSGNSTVTTSAMRMYVSNDNISFYSSGSTTAGATRTFTERMRITSGGYVGIGTTSPQGKLELRGDFENNKALVIHSTYGGGTQHYFRSHGTQGESLAIYNGSNRVFSINPTYVWTDNDRNLSVGTSNNNAQIEVWHDTAQSLTSSSTFSKGTGDKSLILTKKHNSTKDALMGYFGPMLDFRIKNSANTWSNGHIIGVGDPDGSSNHAGGLGFFTNPGAAAGSNVNGVNAGGTNTAAMLMSADQQIIKPRQVAFFARPPTSYGTNGNTIIGSTWSVTNQGGTNSGSQFSTSGVFTVPSTGWYVIHWTCLVATVTDSRLDFYLTKNDAEIARSEINGYTTTSYNRSGAVTGVFYLTKSDYIKFGIRGDAGSATYSSSTPWGYASGYFLG